MHLKVFSRGSMRRQLLRLLLVAGASILLLLGVGCGLFYLNKEQIKEALLRYVQQHQEGEISIGAIRFSPLTHLPDLAIQLNEVVYYEHPGKERLRGAVPILNVKRAYLAFNLLPLLAGRYEVRELTLRRGSIHLRFYPDNSVNLFNAIGINPPLKTELIAFETKTGPEIDLTLERINLENLQVYFLHEGNALVSEVDIESVEAALCYRDGMQDIQLGGDLSFRYFSVGERTYFRNKEIRLGLDLLLDQQRLAGRIRKSRLIFEGLAFDMSGTYDFARSGWADLSLEASDEDLSLLSYLLEDNFLNRNLEVLRHGNLYLSGSIRGKTINHLPEVSFRFGAEDVRLHIPNQEEPIDKLEWSGFFSTGKADDFSQSVFRIDHLSGKLPGGYIEGALEISNMLDPSLTASLRLRADLKGWDQVFDMGSLDSLSGRMDLTMDLSNWRLAGGDRPDKINETRLELEEVSFHRPGWPRRLEGLWARIQGRGDAFELAEGRFRYGPDRFSLEGRLNNVAASLAGLDMPLGGRFRFWAETLRLNDLPFAEALVEREAFSPVKNLYLDVSFRGGIEQRRHFPWTDAAEVVIHQLRAESGQLPASNQLRASATFRRKKSGVLWVGIPSLQASCPVGDLHLKDASFWIGKRSLTGSAFLKADSVMPAALSGLMGGKWEVERGKKREGVLAMKPGDKVDVAFAVQGTYDWKSKKLDTFSIAEGRLQYRPAGKTPVMLEQVNGQIQEAVFSSGAEAAVSSLAAHLSVGRLRTAQLADMRIQCDVRGRADYYFFRGALYQRSDAFEEGTIEVDLSEAVPAIRLAYKLESFPVESALTKFTERPLMSGNVDFSLDLKTHGRDEYAWWRNASGAVILKGEDLVLHGVALQKRLKAASESPPGKLVDLAAYFLLHPAGNILTSGYDMAQIFDLQPTTADQTKVSHLISAWELKNGRLQSRDVALTGPFGRIAMQGALNWRTDRFDDLRVAVVNSKGHPLLDQSLTGTFSDPESSGVNIRTIRPGQGAFYEGVLLNQ